MSEVQQPVTSAAEPTTVSETHAAAPAVAAEPTAVSGTPATETGAATTEAKTDAVAPTEAPEAEAPAAEKAVEPITEGPLAYKGPGLVKSLIATKKEFWLSDAPVEPQHQNLFLRGEKPEVSHAIVAWASQTGRGLLFFNKKGDTEKTRPHDILALYDATDLKKEPSHSFAFKLNGHNHTFKATSDVERDGWYVSIEKAIELGKASKEEIHSSEGYKAELEKLNKPSTAAVAGATGAAAGATGVAATAKSGKHESKKSTEIDRAAAARIGSDAEEETQKKQKSRSTSRGVLNRLRGKKEEVEQKAAEKKEEKEVAKEEKKAEKEEPKETEPVAEAAAPVAAPVVAGAAVAEAPAAATTEETPVEPATETTDGTAEEKAKPAKRGSIFGKLPSGWGSFKSPSKEKSMKEAELKPDTPVKETGVSENPPQLPETTATTEPAIESAIPAVEEPATETKAEAPKETPADAVSPGKEKKNFLSGFGGFMKRDRSVSPSANLKEPAKKEETAVAPVATEEGSEPVAKPEEPVTAVTATEPATDASAPIETTVPETATTEAEKPADKVEEAKADTASPKRQSVFSTLGRRASKAFRGIASPRKENAAPATTGAEAETAEAKAEEETPVVNGETKAAPEAEVPKSIGDVVPEAVNVGQPQHSTPTVTASA